MTSANQTTPSSICSSSMSCGGECQANVHKRAVLRSENPRFAPHREIAQGACSRTQGWRLRCPKGALDLIFPNSRGNPEMHGAVLKRGLYPALRRAGLRRVSFHSLRHFFASALIAKGATVPQVQAKLGHSSATTTLEVYMHVFPDDDGDTEDVADYALGGNKVVTSDDSEESRDAEVIENIDGASGDRTPNLLIKSQLLYQLS